MEEIVDRLANLLREAADLHHRVYRITDGADDDWATWYADWLVRLSELPEVLPRRPVRSELTMQLILCDRAHRAAGAPQPWAEFYAGLLAEFFTRSAADER